MSNKKEVEIVEWNYPAYQEALSTGDKLPSKYHFRNSLGDYVFIKTFDRKVAQEYIDYHHGGLFTVICNGKETSNKPQTAFGTATRKGQKKYN